MIMEMDRVKRSLIITYSHIRPAEAGGPGDQPYMSLEDELLKQRLERIREIEALGYRAYGRRYEFTHTVPQILAEYGSKAAEELTPEIRMRVSGRVMTLRHMGKAGFAHV